MSNDHPMKQVREIFTKARLIPEGSERESYLEEACSGNAELRREVEDLLSVSAQSSKFLKLNVAGQAVGGPEDLIGTIVDRYRIIEHIGKGGFGDVYRVEQLEPIRRELAMKILKHGMCNRDIVERFIRERELLALMDHPNITHIQDAGTTDGGRPYFVMDLVMGIPITEYCDQKRLALPQRLELFKEVCYAVQHAHQKGVLHRDLKPSNIVVVESEGSFSIKIIDFGIAKTLEQTTTEDILRTQIGLFVGTPAYMSPEQISLSSDKIDSRSDIYSLGILLYELVSGEQPFERETLQKAALAEVQRIICEEEPERPSTRLRKATDRTQASAERRSSDALSLIRSLSDDLDWIILKAIEKERDLRYQGIGELIRDIDYHLQNKPIEIEGRGWPYRIKKFMRRHQMATTLVLSLIPVIIIGTIATLVSYLDAKREKEIAQINELVAQVESVKASTFREHLLTLIVGEPESRRYLRNLDFLFKQEGEDVNDPSRQILIQLEGLFQKSKQILADKPELRAKIIGLLADSYSSMGVKISAWKLYDEMIGILREHEGPDSIAYADGLVRYAQSVNYGYYGHITLSGSGYPEIFDWQLVQQGRPREISLLKEAMAIYRKHNHLNDTVVAALMQLSGAENRTSSDKEVLLRELASAGEILYGKDDFRALFCEKQLGLYLVNQGRLEEAKPFWLRMADAFEKEGNGPYWYPFTETSGLGKILEMEGDFKGAEAIYRESIKRIEGKVRGEFSGIYRTNLAMLYTMLHKLGTPEEEVTAKLAKIGYHRGFDPTSSRVDYRIHISQPGIYRLYLRFNGHNEFSDSVSVRLKEKMDGFGGEIADYYGFSIEGLQETSDINLRSFNLPWQSKGFFEYPYTGLIKKERIPVEWTVTEPGEYTLQFMEMESGVALDIFVLQLNTLPPPFSEQIQPSFMNEIGIYSEENGRVIVEAEDFTGRHPGRVTDWMVVPDEQDPIEEFVGISGRGYLQVLPEREWIGPAQPR